jgi:putative addiction module component
MDGYYFIRVKKDYASAIIEDLQKLDAVELLNTADNSIPEWQKKEVLSRLQALDEDPGSGVDWDTAISRIKKLAK